jgi:hypothetical protein
MARQIAKARLVHLFIEAHLTWSGTWRRLREAVGKPEAVEFLRQHKEFPNHVDLVLDNGFAVRGVG